MQLSSRPRQSQTCLLYYRGSVFFKSSCTRRFNSIPHFWFQWIVNRIVPWFVDAYFSQTMPSNFTTSKAKQYPRRHALSSPLRWEAERIELPSRNNSVQFNPFDDLASFHLLAVDDDELLQSFLCLDDNSLESYVQLPQQQGVPFVLDYKNIAEKQQTDTRLQHVRESKPDSFPQMQLAPNRRQRLILSFGSSNAMEDLSSDTTFRGFRYTLARCRRQSYWALVPHNRWSRNSISSSNNHRHSYQLGGTGSNRQ